MGKVTVVGSANTDMIMKVDLMPRPGETVLGGQFFMAQGGKGANQAVAAARAGGQVTFVACLGRDVFGDQAIRGYEADGIDTHHIRRIGAVASGTALIFVDAKGENSIGVASGANAELSVEDVQAARATIETSDVVVMQLETPLPTILEAAHIARDVDVPVVLNPAPARPLPDELLKLVSIITPNETEAEMLTGVAVRDEASMAKAADVLHKRGVETVLLTLGARGVSASYLGSRFMVAAYAVNVVDTTAAGDVFNGALATALSEKKPLEEAVRFASAAAAISVTRMGAQPSAPRREEIEALLLNPVY